MSTSPNYERSRRSPQDRHSSYLSDRARYFLAVDLFSHGLSLVLVRKLTVEFKPRA